MSAPKHTPGPWRMREASGCIPIYDANGRKVCAVPFDRSSDPHDLDRAKAIEALPDLVAALRELVRMRDKKGLLESRTLGLAKYEAMSHEYLSENRAAWVAARAALAKAEGK